MTNKFKGAEDEIRELANKHSLSYNELNTIICRLTCSTCGGVGLVDNAEPCGITYDTEECPECNGRGLKQ